MRIYHNIPALQAYNSLAAATGSLQKSVQKLAAGLRINSAADDAAGLAISEKMRSQVRGLDQAARNAQDGVSLIQTAEGALNETHSMLQRMRELTVQAANDTLTSQDRIHIQAELDQLKEEIDRTASTTQFNRKKLLDGSSSVLWSSDEINTKVSVRGALAETDRFGQKISNEGNYTIEISANPGEGQVQKSNLMAYAEGEIRFRDIIPGDGHIYHLTPSGTQPRNDDSNSVLVDLSSEFPDGLDFFGTRVTGVYVNTNGNITFGGPYYTFTPQQMANVNLPMIAPYFTDVETEDTEVGSVHWNVSDGVFTVTWENVERFTEHETGAPTATFQLQLYDRRDGNFDIVFRYENIEWTDGEASGSVGVHAVAGYTNGGGYVEQLPQSGDREALLALPTTGGNYIRDGAPVNGMWVFQVRNGYVSALDNRYVVPVEKTLGEMTEFWDANGVSILADPQEITIYQGDGRSADIVLYASDTFSSAARKINAAIADDLGQGAYVSDVGKFCTVSDGTAGTSESAYGYENPVYSDPTYDDDGKMVAPGQFLEGYEDYYATLLVRSAMPGAAGELTFSGSEEMLKVLGLATLQDSRESGYRVSVRDAHTGKTVKSMEKITGNTIYGAVTGNIDVTFDPFAGTSVTWNEKMRKFELSGSSKVYQTTVHLADNATTLQIGANEGEDLVISIGDMSARALGVHSVLAVDRESAARAVTLIDRAIDRVSRQRASLGAYQNRLEHTVSSLTVSSENLTASESRIRDLDMAKEMMNFTKLNILVQSSQAMLGQANQLPQNVLSLLR